MPPTLEHASGAVIDLAALHSALSCADVAVVQAFRGDEDSIALSLIEAHAAAEEAFGRGSAEVAALNVLLAAITEAAHSKDHMAGRDVPAPRPASEPLPRNRERTRDEGY
jgi:hypothetical protein